MNTLCALEYSLLRPSASCATVDFSVHHAQLHDSLRCLKHKCVIFGVFSDSTQSECSVTEPSPLSLILPVVRVSSMTTPPTQV